MKKCSKCQKYKEKSNYHKDKSRKDFLYPRCKECNNEAIRVKRSLDRDLYNKQKREEYKNKVERRLYLENWKNLNKEKSIEYKRKWKKENLDKVAARSSLDRATKLSATPKWLTKVQLKEIANMYKRAKELEKITGLKYHVDHIIPLKGKDVCGLHTPWNLQILTAEENIKKGNKVIKENR